eukprot:Gb_28479 [translate_table: standard]
MVVRGAPAIAISAALSLAVEVANLGRFDGNVGDTLSFLQKRLDYLVSSRPTAVNLSDAAKKLQDVVLKAATYTNKAESVLQAYIEAAEEMLIDDISANKAIGSHGAQFILRRSKNCDKLNILTHCNTGSLATAGYGTALGVVRALHSEGLLETAYCTETRPFNQGSRLTAYELVHDHIPVVLIADSAAAALQKSGRVDAIVVGADRIAANGDTANKIGTYNLALSAFHHCIPFYVAAPLTSVDLSLPSGEQIIIEERSPKELTHAHGGQGQQVAPSGISVWNPAFDVTPANLITAIITEKGVITKKDPNTTFDVNGFIESVSLSVFEETNKSNGFIDRNDQEKMLNDRSKGYCPLNEISIFDYIVNIPSLVEKLGGPCRDWIVKEIGDGNLNYVFIVIGQRGSFVLKQALPYIRCIGESWPMTLERAYYEEMALKEHGRLCPEHVPEVFHFDHQMALIVMRYLEPPHIILRKGLVAGIKYDLLAEHISEYLARTLFYTSLLFRSTTDHRTAVARFCGNVELCRHTEQVVFLEPYMESSNNHWTSPHLDEDAKLVREDGQLKLEIADLKSKFCQNSEALIHGDFHTGSVMVTIDSTQVIDPEFAFYGPMGFDLGAFIGNLILAFFAQDGHATCVNERQEYKKWILKTIMDTWNLFHAKFLTLWNENLVTPRDAYPRSMYKNHDIILLAQNKYMRDLFEDTLGFASAKMIRRIVGVAHVEDFESIKDVNKRAECERRALNFAKMLMKQRRNIQTIEQVTEAI